MLTRCSKTSSSLPTSVSSYLGLDILETDWEIMAVEATMMGIGEILGIMHMPCHYNPNYVCKDRLSWLRLNC